MFKYLLTLFTYRFNSRFSLIMSHKRTVTFWAKVQFAKHLSKLCAQMLKKRIGYCLQQSTSWKTQREHLTGLMSFSKIPQPAGLAADTSVGLEHMCLRVKASSPGPAPPRRVMGSSGPKECFPASCLGQSHPSKDEIGRKSLKTRFQCFITFYLLQFQFDPFLPDDRH